MKSMLRKFPGYTSHRQRGQSAVEYVAVCLLLAITLFFPVPQTNPPQAVGELLASKIHDLYSNLTFFLSLP